MPETQASVGESPHGLLFSMSRPRLPGWVVKTLSGSTRTTQGRFFALISPCCVRFTSPLVAKAAFRPHRRTGSVFLRKQEGGGLTVVGRVNLRVCDDPQLGVVWQVIGAHQSCSCFQGGHV